MISSAPAPQPPPLFLLVASERRGEVVLRALGDTPVELLPAWTGLPGAAAGVVVLDGELPDPVLLRVLRDLAEAPGDWSALLVEGEGSALRALPLSPGSVGPLREAAAFEQSIGGMRTLLRSVGRARHDLNNPLTSALAEVQLLLMDHPPGGPDSEMRESLLLVETQLRRIRDLVQGLARFRPPTL